MRNKNAAKTLYMVEMALMVAIIFMMAFTPLGYLRTPGLSITFLTVPVAVGAVLLGPKGGAVCGLAFGLTSFIQGLMGGSAILLVWRLPVSCPVSWRAGSAVGSFWQPGGLQRAAPI